MNHSILRLIASFGPWLAPVPSAFFIARSIYLHLLASWAGGAVPASVNLAVAVIAGLVVELLAIVSVHNALALNRWNNSPRVKRDTRAWERAPMGIALFCVGLYIVTAILLLVILEAAPFLVLYAPILFPLLAIVGALNLAILDQHTARIERYGLAWTLASDRRATAERPQATAERPQSEGERHNCDRCDWSAAASDYESGAAWRNAANAHRGWHTRRDRESPE